MTTTDETAAAAERSDAKRAAARRRPVMNQAELQGHAANSYGRDYSESDEGYGDMQAEQKRGWKVVSGWGRDGWDMGDWPLVSVLTRQVKPDPAHGVGTRFQVMTIVEGDRSVYTLDTVVDQEAALDYLFLWYSAGEDWSPVTYDNREQLEAGQLDVADKFRGWFSWARVEMTRDERAAEREARQA